jgi:hypothetical protein
MVTKILRKGGVIMKKFFVSVASIAVIAMLMTGCAESEKPSSYKIDMKNSPTYKKSLEAVKPMKKATVSNPTVPTIKTYKTPDIFYRFEDELSVKDYCRISHIDSTEITVTFEHRPNFHGFAEEITYNISIDRSIKLPTGEVMEVINWDPSKNTVSLKGKNLFDGDQQEDVAE